MQLPLINREIAVAVVNNGCYRLLLMISAVAAVVAAIAVAVVVVAVVAAVVVAFAVAVVNDGCLIVCSFMD